MGILLTYQKLHILIDEIDKIAEIQNEQQYQNGFDIFESFIEI